ncbi:MAG: hypothetical protein AABY10_05280 [Nanoarchaeota archaeon]
MTINIEDVNIEIEGRSNDSPLEVTLFEGILPNLRSSSYPCAYAQGKASDNPGITVVGYPYERNGKYLSMTSDKITQGETTKLSGWRLYNGSIHSIRKLS